MQIKPCGDRILVEPTELQKKTESGIIIPDTAKEKPIIGKVIEIGTAEEVKEAFAIGDNVLYAKYGGEDITIDNKEYKILQVSDVLAKIVY
ncbi:MAG: co-chaperone GroES [Ignavibacteria bacterium GWF2_33_9]|nr:MAG: co-chaperone GroES [Ignavibacteria bacterium GWF2_33_9]